MSSADLSEEALSSIASSADKALHETSSYVLFDSTSRVLAARGAGDVSSAELLALAGLYKDRDGAISSGMVFQGVRYEVHRHYTTDGNSIIYGRTTSHDVSASVGAALCRREHGITGNPCYAFITFKMPLLTAKMVPVLEKVCDSMLVKS